MPMKNVASDSGLLTARASSDPPRIANTERTGANTVFTNMPAYRRSKPKADYHLIYQVVTYRGDMPIMVSCKVKGSAHLRAAYGEDAAGEQLYCPTITRMTLDQAVAELEAAGDSAAGGMRPIGSCG